MKPDKMKLLVDISLKEMSINVEDFLKKEMPSMIDNTEYSMCPLMVDQQTNIFLQMSDGDIFIDVWTEYQTKVFDSKKCKKLYDKISEKYMIEDLSLEKDMVCLIVKHK